MSRNVLALTLLALTLGGCVLQSRHPLFDDSRSELALGNRGGMARSANFKNGKWVDSGEPVRITVEGKHYVLEDKSRMTFHFAKLEGSRYVVQAEDAEGASYYGIADVKEGVATARVLDCDDLSSQPQLTEYISFEKYSCFIKPDADTAVLFRTLMAASEDSDLRLELTAE